MKACRYCQKPVPRKANTYCNNRCQIDFHYTAYIQNWQAGLVSGNVGVNAQALCVRIRRYLFEKYGSKCALCGWSQINPYSGKPPLEVDHIDGNFDNSTEANLRLLCPNCHSLTKNYRSLNRGKGRAWRRHKYLKVIP